MPLRFFTTILLLALSTGCAGKQAQSDQYTRGDETQQPSLEDCINETCPRSGKPVVASSLTTYRGVTVGFCNEHCRDDFAAHVEERLQDREFFDAILTKRE